ncbi:MAG: molybdate ABC transporter permease subunit [Actinomycetota bacterium]
MKALVGRTSPIVVALAGLGLAFVVLPVAGLLVRAPWSDTGGGLAGSAAWTALRLSIVVSTAAALVTLGLGFPLAWVLARARFAGRSLARAFVILPLVLPPVVGGVGLLTALGRNGIVGRYLAPLGVELPFTTAGAIVAAAFVSMPLMVLAVEAGLRSLDPRLEQAAATMGASRWYTFRRVTLPLLRPQIVAGLVLSWARALGEFGATITFAGNLEGRTQTLPLAVFETLQTDPGGAIIVSLLLVALSVAVLVALRERFLPR